MRRYHSLFWKADIIPETLIEDFIRVAIRVITALFKVMLFRRIHFRATKHDLQVKLYSDVQWPHLTKNKNLRCTTINALPEKVWPWIAQIARGAAFYSWDFLDNPGYRHPDYLLEGLPEPTVGDRSPALGVLKYVSPGDEMIWYDDVPLFIWQSEFAANYKLLKTDNNKTRLILGIYFKNTGRLSWLGNRIEELMDYVMASEQIKRLKVLIETYDERLAKGEINKSEKGHQNPKWALIPAGKE